MTKKRKNTTPQLYNHNDSSTIHRNISVTDDGRRRRINTNVVEIAAVNSPSVAPYTPDSLNEDDPYDDKHIPINSEDADTLAGIKVKAKRYANSVNTILSPLEKVEA